MIGFAVVNSENSTANFLIIQLVKGFYRTLGVNKVRVGKSSWLAGSAINRDANISNILDVLEEVIQVAVCHVKRQIADEQSARLLIFALLELATKLWLIPPVRILDRDTTAVQRLAVHVRNGSLRAFLLDEINITESEKAILAFLLVRDGLQREEVPFTQASGISDDLDSFNRARLGELPFDILFHGLKENITNEETTTWGGTLFKGRRRCLSLSITLAY